MKILQVLPHLSKGGAERVVVELSNSLVQVEHEVTILLAFPVDPVLNQNDLSAKIPVFFLTKNRKNKFIQYIKIPFWVLRNWNYLKKFDVIHCHLSFGLILGAWISIFRKFSNQSSLKLIATCHVVGVGVTKTPRILNENLSYFFDAFVLMALDMQWRSFISSRNRNNVSIIFNGVTPNSLKNVEKRYAKRNYWTVGTISRLHSERKPWLFLEIFENVKKLRSDEVKFVLGGEGSEWNSLVKQSEKLGLKESLLMPGLIREPKSILDTLDVYVTLNIEEITGIAGLEAIFAGIPVVGIQLSASYTNGANDWIWSNHDTMVVAQKIVELLSNPTQLAAIADKQFKIASEKYTVEVMCNSYLSLYKGLK
jgi:glycosyltransferase involved in cell wall biosynthesis